MEKNSITSLNDLKLYPPLCLHCHLWSKPPSPLCPGGCNGPAPLSSSTYLILHPPTRVLSLHTRVSLCGCLLFIRRRPLTPRRRKATCLWFLQGCLSPTLLAHSKLSYSILATRTVPWFLPVLLPLFEAFPFLPRAAPSQGPGPSVDCGAAVGPCPWLTA